MKLCLPIHAPDGLDSLLEPYLPNAEHLLVFDTATRAFEQISLLETARTNSPSPQFDAVVCGSINRVTMRALIERGITIFGTESSTVRQVIAEHDNRELEAAVVAPEGRSACHGHESHEGSGCGCSHNHGHEHGGACGGKGGGCGDHAHGGEGGCCGSRKTPSRASTEASSSEAQATLRIAVCSQNRKTVTEHAGKCRKFWIYEVTRGELSGKSLLELPIEQSLHATGGEQAHPLDSVNVLITAGMGSGLHNRLLQRGIQGIVTTVTNPDQAVAEYLAGVIPNFPPKLDWTSPTATMSNTARTVPGKGGA